MDDLISILTVGKTLKRADLLCYMAIAMLGQKALHREIAAQTGYSRRQVIRSIQGLEAAGVLAVDRSSNRNRYTLAHA